MRVFVRQDRRLFFSANLISSLCALLFLTSTALLKAETPEVGASIKLLPRKTIPFAKFGLNAFANDPRFGSVHRQYQEVRSTLRVRYVRVLFAWTDGVQPTPNSPINFSFYDDIIRSIPRKTDALIVVTHLPNWMFNPSNWIDGDPRKTFLQKYLRPVLDRYGKKRRVFGVQLWNEPNALEDTENQLMGWDTDATLYVQFVGEARTLFADYAPRKKLVMAATTSINQNFPESLNYNKALVEAGIEDIVDVFTFHYYGSHLENVLLPGGVLDFLEGRTLPLWMTESGERGVNKQREYVERLWPFLASQLPKLQRMYYYQFTSGDAPQSSYGLRNPSKSAPVSDLYIALRNRK